MKNKKEITLKKKPSLLFSLATLLAVTLFIALGYSVFKINFTLLLFLSWLVVAAFVAFLGYSFSELESFAYETAQKIIGPATIILSVGIMVASFMASGTVPTILVIGLQIITPELFFMVTFLLCAVTSTVTGTSWGTIGTIGIAMVGVGAGLNLNPAITAGAIVSGSYFGDKMSPVSDSTMLASTLTGTNIWVHIKHMISTTVPAAVITAIILLIIGIASSNSAYDPASVNQLIDSLKNLFNIDFISLIPIIVVILLIIRRTSTIGALLIGALLGGIVAIVHQGYSLTEVGKFLSGGFVAQSDDAFVKGLLNRGGMNSMLDLIGTFIAALGLGGMLSSTGLLQPLFEAMLSKIKTPKGVLLAAWFTMWICILAVPTYNFGFVMLATLFTPLMKKFNLKSENLSRIIEDVGTLGGELLPWTVGAVYAYGILGISAMEYARYNFFSMLVPIISLIYILTNFTIKYNDNVADKKDELEKS